MPYPSSRIFKHIYPSLQWDVQDVDQQLFLTFDDGPHPTITPWVLDQLKQYDFKASFFCIGENMIKYPEVVERIIKEGHTLGNHTLSHMNGFKNDEKTYLQNVKDWSNTYTTAFFRPPYGRITRAQIKELKEQYQIVMWSLLSWDFKKGIDQNKYLEYLKKYSGSGQIVVFHDSDKAEDNLKYMLPPYLEYLKGKGYSSKALGSIS